MGDRQDRPFQLSFNGLLKIDFQRIPANDSLERDIAELLTRPVVCYKSFLYRAASWKTARRVVAKVEFHCGELFPRVGFMVTNLLSLIANNLGNLWRRLVLPRRIENWSLTSLQQRLVRHARYYWLMLAERGVAGIDRVRQRK